MRFAVPSLIVLMLVSSASADEPLSEEIVNKAVANAEPLWLPKKGTLTDWTVGIDPAWSHSPDIQQRRRDDLDLITATYLYHFVLRAGGSPVLSHADRTLASSESTIARKRRTERMRAAETDLLVQLASSADNDGSIRIEAAQDAASQRMAECLRASLGAATVSALDDHRAGAAQPPAPDGARLLVPTCRICFSRPTNDAPTAAVRRASYADACRVFAGLREFAAAASPISSARHAQFAKPDLPTASSRSRAQSLARSIWPQGELPDDHLGWFCDAFARAAITNHSLVFFDVSARRDGQGTLLEGRTNVPHIVTGLARALAAVGHQNINNNVQALPNPRALEQHCFGACRVPMALTFSRPGGGALQTQLLYGEPVFLLDKTDDYLLLHARDGYWGWVHASAIEPLTAARFNTYLRLPRMVATRDIEHQDLLIPRGAVVRSALAAGPEPQIHLPDGNTLAVPLESIAFLKGDDTAGGVCVRAALDMLYVPYVFGGRSSLGIDCSGFATNLAARLGHTPARDAWQQALAGQLIATSWHRDQLAAGDQLFFINSVGKIYHTGIALDATHVIHAAPPCVKINSLDPASPLYDEELDQDFFIAKRP